MAEPDRAPAGAPFPAAPAGLISTPMSDAFAGLPDPDLHAEFYADVPTKRFIAWLVDVAVVFFISVLLVPLTAFTAIFYFPVFALCVGFLYRFVTIARKSATWGMRLTSIELRTGRGERLDSGLALMHTALFLVFFSFLVPQVVSIGLVLTGRRAQTLHDHVLGVAAINRAAG